MKILFDLLTDPLGLPINPIIEWIIMIIIGEIAYRIAFYIVGESGASGTEARLAHWSIRIFIYFIIWAVARAVIWVIRNWKLCLLISSSIIGTICICIFAVFIMRCIKKHKKVNGNA